MLNLSVFTTLSRKDFNSALSKFLSRCLIALPDVEVSRVSLALMIGTRSGIFLSELFFSFDIRPVERGVPSLGSSLMLPRVTDLVVFGTRGEGSSNPSSEGSVLIFKSECSVFINFSREGIVSKALGSFCFSASLVHGLRRLVWLGLGLIWMDLNGVPP